VTLKRVLALVPGLGALALAACSTVNAINPIATKDDEPQPTLAGTYLAANFAAAEGDVKAASSYYATTLKDDPDNQDLLARTFLYAAESGDIEGAATLADRVIMQEAQNRPAHLVRQMSAMQAKDYAAVLKDIETPNSIAFAALTNDVVEAWAHAGLHDVDGALHALDALSQQRGVDGLRLFHKALVLEYSGRDKEAETAYRDALALTGMGPRAADAFGRFLRRHGRSEDAKAVYTKSLSESPGNPVAAAALKEIAANKSTAPLVSTPAEGVGEALFGIAASLNDQRSADVAILYLNLTLYLHPDFDLARVLLANHYETLRKFDLANVQYAAIAPASPYYVMTQVQGALNEGRMDKPEVGAAKLKVLSVQQPKDLDVWTALGDLLRSSDRYADAAAAYDKAIATLPAGDRRLVGLYYARGVSRGNSNRWDDAEKDFQSALKINPDRADVLNYLGYSWIERGQHQDEAVAMLEKAHALRPLDGFIADSVGWAYYRTGRYQDAARTLEEAVMLSPGAPDINDHLGDAYWRIGRKIDARFQWQHALALKPDAKQKPIIERKLQFGLDEVSASGQ
jgi:tetratricopeptide (TPR) repeat protein